MASLISIGLSGLSASQTALATTGNNIANVDTAGYSRQSVVQKSASAEFIGVGYVGNGTTVADVRRIYSEYLNTQLRTSTGLDAEAQTYLTQINQTDALLADSTTGISSVLSSFFEALQTAAENPTDASARALLLTNASGLAERFSSVYSQLADQNTYINSQLSSMAEQVNQLASSIANYNQAIVQASASGATPNDLLDARDQALVDLSELIGVTVVMEGNNANVFIGSGQPLVMGNTASTLTAEPSTTDPTRLNLMLTSGYSSVDVTSVVSGGSISGLVRYREEVLDPTLNELGRLALVIADQVNSQLGQGIDLNGDFGTSLFSDINSALAASQRSLAQAGNSAGSGNLSVYIEDSSKLSTSDYEVTFSSATGYSVRRLSDGADLGSYDLSDDPAPVIDGFSLAMEAGTVAAGDKFTIIPTRTAAGSIGVVMTDASKLAFAAPLVATSSSGNYGTGSISSVALASGSALDIYDAAANADTQASIQNAMPVKLVFDAASGSAQGYTLYDVQGNALGTGSIVPGQSNTVTVSIAANPPSVPSAFEFELAISGSPAAGDSFTVAFNADSDSDNRNALALLDLQTASTIGKHSITSTYSQLIETVGAKASQAALDASATSTILSQATANRESVSGVNLDEEAANLIKFQQYYTAAAQVIKAAQQMFDTIINTL
ncbi:flagellar hook-associated protein FlgK [Stutzerimonas stutzeri]|uniref:Flagellar hook-associated protein 1 n=3 Tax=Stutzerimonas stutzeri TaxID=316 RepID=A4VJD7_STUS1|nr:flagellar hook-associated protein FlgK [Stutzerimonas stutzeri]HAJ86332.1 flagellar hook-associated protein FlgK [Pseudomonas sp.]ABP79088.1 flagellar hook-associated protein FlgK [Stutzerimonas stutzeri A1501]KOR09401.1 flagellar hook protein FlgK [Stutzerimonas stutzeri]MCQ4236544.1 flagellar hook-associated protein FlgK [Stutzerimonas stutzeri]MDH1670632.1 flagellar hook-associated protein FlgK [Stutzerimonas stutzeri]